MQSPIPLGQMPSVPLPTQDPVFGISYLPVVNPLDAKWKATRSSSNDSAAWQRAMDSLADLGGTFLIPPSSDAAPWRVRGITPPAGVSITIVGQGQSNSVVALPTAGVLATHQVFDLTNRNGPAVNFFLCKIIGVGGLGVGVGMATTNGAKFFRVWFGGLTIGRDLAAPCTDIVSVDCINESCGQGVRFQSAPTACSWIGDSYFDNVQDLQVTGDCSTFIHANSRAFRCTNVSVLAQNVTDFTLESHVLDGCVNGIHLNNAQDSVLSNIRHIRKITAEYVNTGTFRVFANGCNGDLSPFVGAGLYLGHKVGNRRIVYTSGAPNSLSWTAGDIAYPIAPAVGNPVGYARLTTGAANVLGVDWRALANLA